MCLKKVVQLLVPILLLEFTYCKYNFDTKIIQIIKSLKIKQHFMKRSILFIFLSCFISFGICQAKNPVEMNPRTQPSPHPRVPAKNCVNAYTEDAYLYLSFEESVGIATITITDQTGFVIYQEQTNTDISTNLSIPIDTLKSGNYILTVQYGSISLSGYLIL